MKMKTTASGLASLVELFLQEHMPTEFKNFDFEPTTIKLHIAQDPKVPGGLAISAIGRDANQISSLDKWLQSGDTGISSCSIFTAITQLIAPHTKNTSNWPRDPSDFGRCFRLLERFPTWRTELQQVSIKYPGWTPMIMAWTELETLYTEELKNHDGRAPKLYARLQELGRQCEDFQAKALGAGA